MKITVEQLVELEAVITDPDQFLLGPKMPAWYNELSDDEKADVLLELTKLTPQIFLKSV